MSNIGEPEKVITVEPVEFPAEMPIERPDSDPDRERETIPALAPV